MQIPPNDASLCIEQIDLQSAYKREEGTFVGTRNTEVSPGSVLKNKEVSETEGEEKRGEGAKM